MGARKRKLQTLLDNTGSWTPPDPRETAGPPALRFARCRLQGITIRFPDDCLIADCAVQAGGPLLHAGRDFERIAAVEPHLRFV